MGRRTQVLVAAMNQVDHSLIKRMNIETDAIIGNQCDYNSVEDFEYNGKKIKYLNFAERGVGLNRNNALMRADGDILIFADEDEIFVKDYSEIITKAYDEIPDADAIIFNIKTIGNDVGRRNITKVSRVCLLNAMNYGAARLSVKNDAVKRKNMCFHRQFGGGTVFSSGEDTLFIVDLIRKGLKVYVYPVCLASVDQTNSSWFEGYTEKYFYDKGALFAAISKHFGWILCRLVFWKNRKRYNLDGKTYKEYIKVAKSGFRNYEKGISYQDCVRS